jgi:hypothetical protein
VRNYKVQNWTKPVLRCGSRSTSLSPQRNLLSRSFDDFSGNSLKTVPRAMFSVFSFLTLVFPQVHRFQQTKSPRILMDDHRSEQSFESSQHYQKWRNFGGSLISQWMVVKLSFQPSLRQWVSEANNDAY